MNNSETAGISGLPLIYPVRMGYERASGVLRGSGIRSAFDARRFVGCGQCGFDVFVDNGKAYLADQHKMYTCNRFGLLLVEN